MLAGQVEVRGILTCSTSNVFEHMLHTAFTNTFKVTREEWHQITLIIIILFVSCGFGKSLPLLLYYGWGLGRGEFAITLVNSK